MKFTLTRYGTLTLTDTHRRVSLSKQEVEALKEYLFAENRRETTKPETELITDSRQIELCFETKGK